MKRVVETIATRGAWDAADLENYMAYYKEIGKKKPEKYFTQKLDSWAQGEVFGNQVLHALQTYYEVFFAEEERRIRPAIEAGLLQAQAFARQHSFQELLESISQGVRYGTDSFKDFPVVVLAPSFWASPFLFMSNFTSNKTPIFLFGARSDEASLTPGELVPDALMAALNALSDPTRLRILRYLFSETLTATQLATRLRLRPPTVVHHLKALRAAGLIFVNPGEQKKDVFYQTRTERLTLTCAQLEQFVAGKDDLTRVS